MNEKADFLQPDNLPTLPERLGLRMLEGDSTDRIIDGLKMAGDGMMHLAHWRQDFTWEVMAHGLDALRIKLARRARSRSGDELPSRDPGGMGTLTTIECYQRVYDGLSMASRACRQMATGHRGDLAWSKAANDLDMWKDRMSKLVRTRKRQSAAPSILLPN